MRKPQLCALLSLVSVAALQTWPAAAASPQGGRQLSQEHWMFQQEATAEPAASRPAVRVHFFHPNQVVRVSRTVDAPVLRPATAVRRPFIRVPASIPNLPRLIASHEVRDARQPVGQPEIRSGR
jgi:hypothetical protein